MKELPKAYNPKEVEDKIYERWEASGFFNPDNLVKADNRFLNAASFSIAIPPPNVTGELHIGHSMFLTIQDIMIRHARMQGKKALWIPGTDHAAIATNFVVERQIWEKEKKTRHDLGRDEFLRRVNEFIEDTQGTIQKQIRKMGASCDWSREKYTLSDELSLAVRTMFKKMYDSKLIYRGKRIVNWCPRCATTLSNDEVEYKKVRGKFYYIRYPLVGSNKSITVATVRPETMLGDTGVAVNPKDERYTKLVGQNVMLPLVNRELPIVADASVMADFGTGALKVTPGHSENDFEIAQKHNLDIISAFTKEGTIDDAEAINHGFEDYAGLTFEKARLQITKDLEEAGFLEKVEDIEHNVGYCYRCHTASEPMLSKQWFVDVNKKIKIKNKKFQKNLNLGLKASLKEMAINAVKSGSIKIVPERFEKQYFHWMENLHDWNISRQLWFGHQIPVWYKNEEIYVGVEAPTEAGWTEDEDTLDTWFSSSLWTFSTLGWPSSVKTSEGSPESGSDLDLFHPTTIMETGYDILTFWVSRMIIMSSFALQDIPFETVYLHGMVRDEKGKKMSKSLQNVINPLEVIEEYGTDALRLSLIIGSTPGQDLKISKQKIAGYRNFANKFWNIARYILSGITKKQDAITKPSPKTLADEWILAELNNLIADVNKLFTSFQYGLAGEKLTEFTWNKFADWYLEISKIQNKKSNSGTNEILLYVLENLLKLWHPFIPFVTEHIWSLLSDEMLMIQPYPAAIKQNKGAKKIKQFESLQELIVGLRNLRAEYGIKSGQKVAVYIKLNKNNEWLDREKDLVENLARIKLNEEEIPDDKKMPYFIWSAQGGSATKVYLIIANFDPAKELRRAEKRLKESAAAVDKLESQMASSAFTKKAPPEIVEKAKEQLTQAMEKQESLLEKIKSLK